MEESASGNYFAHLRESYSRDGLSEDGADRDPLRQFERWFGEAVASGIREPNAMTLATVAPDATPDARIVLLKDVTPAGFGFFTNHESSKGRQIAACPSVALVFFWPDLERQVRIFGTATRMAAAESLEYFRTRPRGSQLGAWASRQSSVIAGRTQLEEQLAEVTQRFGDGEVPLPAHWGGYRVRPHTMEFWQGRVSRLHDRLRYRKQGLEWIRERISP